MTLPRYLISDLSSKAERELFKEGYERYDEILAYLEQKHNLRPVVELDCGMYIDPDFKDQSSHKIGTIMINPQIKNYFVQVFSEMYTKKEKEFVDIKCSAILDEYVFYKLLNGRLTKWPDWLIFGKENCLANANQYMPLEHGIPLRNGVLDQIKLTLDNVPSIKLKPGHNISQLEDYKELIDCFLNRVTNSIRELSRYDFSSVKKGYEHKNMILTLMPEMIKSGLASSHTEEGEKEWKKIVKMALLSYEDIILEAESIWKQ